MPVVGRSDQDGMKKLAFALSAVALVFALGACDSEDPDDDTVVVPVPSVSTSVMPVPSVSASPYPSVSTKVSVSASASPVDPCDLLDGQAKRVCENDVPGDGGR